MNSLAETTIFKELLPIFLQASHNRQRTEKAQKFYGIKVVDIDIPHGRDGHVRSNAGGLHTAARERRSEAQVGAERHRASDGQSIHNRHS